MALKLSYFAGVYGRGEAIRMLLAHKKIQYEKDDMDFPTFGARKAAGEFPSGQVPVWQQDGKQYNESKAILRFLGAQHGYYPNDINEAWLSDAVVDYLQDFLAGLYPIQMNKKFDEAGQAEYTKFMTTLVEYLNKILLKHGKKYIAGTDSLTIADFMVASIVFSHVHNDSIVGGATFTDIGKAIVAKNEAFAVYVERLRTDLSDYLATR